MRPHPQFDDEFRRIARELIQNTKREIPTPELFEMDTEDTFPVICEKVAELSGGKIKIERVRAKDGFPYIIQGFVVYCARVDATTNTRRLFVLCQRRIELY